MFLLMRKISPYTGPDLLLGVFWDEPSALAARATYIANLQAGIWNDDWKGQAYREVDLEKDICIREMATPEGVRQDTRWVFVVSGYIESFGQIVRRFEGICTNRTDAEGRARAIEARAAKGVVSCKVAEMPVGILQERQ